jgi:hypothetical protein
MTIYHNEIGNLGNIGNQMFQYASLQGIAYHRGLDWKIPPKNNFGKNYSLLKSNIYDCFYLDLNIDEHIGVLIGETRAESKHGFDQDLFENCPDDVNISGYLQSYKYFDAIKNKIRRDFTFLPSSVEVIPQKNTLSIHVRRTDYLSLSQYHTNLTNEYYSAALDIIGDFSEAIVFSDDIDWCKTLPIFEGFTFSLGDSYTDLQLMSKCDKHIIANSSFSWWGAWLSGSDNVVAPKEWFGPALPDHDTDGYYLPSWTVI